MYGFKCFCIIPKKILIFKTSQPVFGNFAPSNMFASLPSFGLSLQPWQLELLYELFPQVVPGNAYARQPRGVRDLLILFSGYLL
jgi:hypothetical protein